MSCWRFITGFLSAALFCVLLSAWIAPTVEAWVRLPKRCCSPDIWEADAKSFGATTRTRDPDNKIITKYSYDYTNKRWAFDYKDPDVNKSRRFVFDYKSKSKYVITHNGCFNISLDAEMFQYCVPENTTYHGYYEHPGQDPALGYDVWSYEHFFYPIRTILKVSRDRCLPLQDSAYTLFRNRWRWYEGEPPCNPWAHPEQAESGECFKCHTKIKVEKYAPRPGAFLSNMDFRNVNLTITNHDIFKIPSKCEIAADWPESLVWNDFWRVFMMRRQAL